MLKPSLESWYNGTINLQAVDLEFCRNKARSIQAFRSGRAPPDSSWKISSQKDLVQPFLVKDSLIWIAEGGRQVNMVNMRSMSSRTLVDPSRGEINHLYAADDLVTFSVRSRGSILASELNGTGPVKRFRMQSPAPDRMLALTCRHRTVACAMHLENYTVVYIWDYDTTRCRSFEINRLELPILTLMYGIRGVGLLLQPNTETLVICQFNESAGNSHATLLHWRFSYAGQLFSDAEQKVEHYDQRNNMVARSLLYGTRSSLAFIPASHDGLYMLQSTFNTGSRPGQCLQYDDKLQRFTSPQCPGLYPVNTRNSGDVFWWKDVFVETGVKQEIIVHRGTTSAPNPVSDEANGPGPQRMCEDLLINDRYIVRSFAGSFYVFSYDHTVQLPSTTCSLHGIGHWEVIKNGFPTANECLQTS